jgi:hypothetical protein
MPTLILTPRFTEDAQALWRAASLIGWNVERLPSWRVPVEIKRVPEPVLYLEGLMGPTLAAEFGLRLIEPPINWLPMLPEEYRKRWIRLSTLGEARSLSEPAFIKPPNDKSFPAAVCLGADLPTDFLDDLPVLVSEVVTWEKEFRCFLLDRRLRAFSIYLRNGELQRPSGFSHTDEEAMEMSEYVQTILADRRIDLPRAAVLDVGVIRGRGWAVIEQNAAWGSGIYGCDPAEVLEVLRHAALPVMHDAQRAIM